MIYPFQLLVCSDVPLIPHFPGVKMHQIKTKYIVSVLLSTFLNCRILLALTLALGRDVDMFSSAADPGLILVTILRSGNSCRARLPKGEAINGNLPPL